MIKNVFYIILILLAFSCSTTSKVAVLEGNESVIDSVEYELVVFDPGFNFWFLTHQKPVWYHTQSHYKYWNTIYVNEWNHRYNNPIVFGTPYDYFIDYDIKEDYGVELEHELYWFFRFIEDKYSTSLFVSGR